MESAFKRNLEVLLSNRERERSLQHLKSTMRISPLGSESMELPDNEEQGGMSMDDLDSELTTYLEFLQKSVDTSDTAALFAQLAREEKRKEPMRKHDIRRYFSAMFFNAINSTDFDEILAYFETFMHATAPLDIVYYSAPLTSSTNTVHHLRVEGPHTSTYYIMCLGALFPDMVTVCQSGQVVTSASLPGCKLILEATFETTKLSSIPIDMGLQQLAALYDEYRRTMFMFPLSHLSVSSTDSESSPSNRRRTEGKAARRNVHAPSSILQTKVHAFASHIPMAPDHVPMVVKCTYVIMLDERNHICSISVTAVRES